jgi:glutamate dehydrogenase (NAD(P)+)
MTRRWEEQSKYRLFEAIRISTGLRIDVSKDKNTMKLLEGPSEKDLVFTALEDSMMEAVKNTKRLAD